MPPVHHGEQQATATENADAVLGAATSDKPQTIAKSWDRCRAYGLDWSDPSDFGPIRSDSLSDELERNQYLVSHALPVLETLYQQLAGSHSMVLLTDEQGLILHSLGDSDFLERAQRVALRPGVSWSEDARGTNAIGTALIERSPVSVNGAEHFLQANRFLTCSAVPITDPRGKMVGVLDVTGDHRGHSSHTIALVKMSAQMIENHLFSDAFPEGIAIHMHSRPEFLGTLCEGIVSFSPDGEFIAANRSACSMLGRNLADLRSQSFSSLFGTRIQNVLDQTMAQGDMPLRLTLNSGSQVLGRVKIGLRARRNNRIVTFDRKSETSRREVPAAPAGNTRGALAGLMTGDTQIEAVCDKVRRVLGRDITILIQGETGTGKELLANAIHEDSPRTQGPFVAVNCASIPDTLIESELFGYEEGAFTGAKRKGNVGKILQADGGTLFLDEIGDMPLNLQARLLRVLQERKVTPLGSIKAYPVDIAIVCATNRKLRDMVSHGEFREDLYYRLNGLTVNLPPLRTRSDIRPVVGRILRNEAPHTQPRVSDDVMELFLRHPWPGNLRQLTYLLRTALVMAEEDGEIRREHLPDDFLDELAEPVVKAADRDVAPAEAAADTRATFSDRLDDLELQAIREALEKHRGNVSAASRQLGISRNTVYRKMKSL